ncbi:Tic20 family membrane protein implicated in protein translocation [Methanonatronarchaeum thermophilum]|uniref:Tic20 family membrane protein implicated in protein translocation n=1 Tax=Methanonatronarchaeum thermophilum TaxID=1927129 RepID=A0A1Y3GAD7_9EURY|nr:DUF4870 domain-containing protein [Methanonatronarchaeum thermophilum]OUJ18388.1 Tic20 family membrane protein implicated in protein translocation [Methanonatronarchaeum thermophilum]
MSENSETSTGLSPNIAGALSYLFGFITGILFYFIEKDNEFVRYHAVQSIVVFGGLFVVYVVLGIVGTALTIGFLGSIIGLLVWLFMLVLGLLSFVLWLYLMYKAYKGEKTRLPVVSQWTDKYSGKKIAA